MRKKINLILIACAGAFAFYSCEKPGCTDENATNYSVDAKDDDNSCTYRSEVTFWCLPSVSDAFIADGHDTLRFELEGVIVDSVPTVSFFSPTGECNTPGVKTIPREIGSYDKRYYKYRVRGHEFVTIREGFIQLLANECLQIELE
jgi:hypothetical protein